MNEAKTARPGRKALVHLGLAPVYLALLVMLGALATGTSPGGAWEAGVAALTMAILPVLLVMAGWRYGERRLLRLALVVGVLEVVVAGWLQSPGRVADYGVTELDASKTQARLAWVRETGESLVVEHAKRIAACGPRATGTAGLEKTLAYVRGELARLGWKDETEGNADALTAPPAARTVRTTRFPTLTSRDEGSRIELAGRAEPLSAFALMPNGVQPCKTPASGAQGELIYLGRGTDADLVDKDPQGKIAVFEFESGRTWLWACESGAIGAVLLDVPGGTGETARQADAKFSGIVPLDFARLYVHGQDATELREASQAGRKAVLHSGMTLAPVQSPVLEAFIPGRSEREFLVMAHADARAIAPALSHGGQEAFGLAAWLALFEHFSRPEHQPGFSLRFVLTTGHWQMQSAGRAYAYAVREAVGKQIAMSFGVDINPESDSLVLTDAGSTDLYQPAYMTWLRRLLFTQDRRFPAWLDQLETLSERPVLDRGGQPSKYAFFGGHPNDPSEWIGQWLAPADFEPPLTHSALHPAANDAMTQLGGLSLTFRTCRTYRQKHFTCRDLIEPWLPQTAHLGPQLDLIAAFLGALGDLDPQKFPAAEAYPYHYRGGYNRVEVQVLRWDPSILWYDRNPPKDTRLFVLLVPASSRFQRGRSNAYWPRPLAPTRFGHRQLQCLQHVYVAEADQQGRAVFENVYTPNTETVYDALAFGFDRDGRLVYAFDQGFHGDAEFHFLDRKLGAPRSVLQVPVFPCGALTFFSMVDVDRIAFNLQVESEYLRQGGIGNSQDAAEAPYLPIRSVREADTHTEVDSFSWVQFRDLAMVFLKPGQRCEILAGSTEHKPAFFNDDPQLREAAQRRADQEGVSLAEALALMDKEAADRTEGVLASLSAAEPEFVGFRVRQGEERRLLRTRELGYRQLHGITGRRIESYAEQNVKSPRASLYMDRAEAHAQAAIAHQQEGATVQSDAHHGLAWSAQAHAYRQAYRLLLDVVSTTIFYFMLLLPFGYLVERLLFPQRRLFATSLVVAAAFVLFTGLLYVFHPGFHLASNIFVTIVTFVIVILTLPALFLTVSRGIQHLMAPGAHFKKRHTSGAETWGVLSSALSLAVNNMRRRKLRTGLTLSTITLLVMSLVLLTSTAADTAFYREEQIVPKAPYRGVQVFNTHDHTHGLSEETVRIVTRLHRDRARVAVRRYFNPGYEAVVSCYARKKGNRTPKRFTVRGAIALDAGEPDLTGFDRAVEKGRFFNPGEARACLLSKNLARDQKLEAGDTVNLFGMDLELVGILNDTDLDAGVVDLSGKPVTPLAFYRPTLSVDNPDHLLARETIFVPMALVEREQAVPFPAFSIVIEPDDPAAGEVERRVTELRAWMAEAKSGGLGSAGSRLLAAAGGSLDETEAARALEAPETLEELARYNLERTRLKSIGEQIARDHALLDVFLTAPAPPWDAEATARVELLSAFSQVSLKSGSFLVLPFLVSFFMLLAIMVGSVYERRREIYVFSSVGLAPRHVAGMFLAEAVVYAGIGSVLGYFLGIILLDVFRRFGMLPENFYPNYFGKVVIWSAVLATGSSLLSVLYPMRIASRLVNPSLERIWRIDTKPDGLRWTIHLPFIAHDREEVFGILAFAGEFLGHHLGERTGVFAIETDPFLKEENGEPVLHARVWLAPFERDLVQDIRLIPRHDPGKERYHFDLAIERLSGPDYLWQKSNHAFVDGLRKQMLIWRSLGEDAIREYTRKGREALAAAPNVETGRGG